MNGSIRIETQIENKTFDAQLKDLETKLSKEETKLNQYLKIQPNNDKAKQDILQLIDRQSVKVEKLKNQIISLQQAKNKLEQNKSVSFDKSFNSAKKLISGILKISSAYALVSKASSAYLATDTSTTKQIETNWVGLGTILEPAIKFITDLMKKAVTSVLYFLSVLTGTDYIAKANANAIKKQTDATKELAKANEKATYSFDEMNVQNSNKNSSSIDDDVINSLFDINDLSENLKNSIEKIAGALKPIYNILKEIIGWALDNPEVIISILGGAALLTSLAKIIGVMGTGTAIGTGLAGILGILLAIASIGVITICIKTMIDAGADLIEADNNTRSIIKSVGKERVDLVTKIDSLGQSCDTTSEQIDTYAKSLSGLAKSSLEALDRNSDEYMSMNELDKLIGSLTGRNYQIKRASVSYSEAAFAEITAMYNLYKQGKLNDKQTQEYIDTLLYYTEVVGKGGTSTGELTFAFSLSIDEAEKLSNQYKTVSTMLADVYFNSDKTTNSFSWLNTVMKNVPKSIQTKIESNVENSINIVEKLTTKMNEIPLFKKINVESNGNESTSIIDRLIDKINKIPSSKKVNVETNITANDTSAKNTINNLLNRMTSSISSITSAFGLKINIPKLAVGGIVNNPGKGVPIGSAITGEAGKEGVLPLTNSATMAELGREIGKWITVNNVLNNYMDGRLIQRQFSKIEQDKNFATNGRG